MITADRRVLADRNRCYITDLESRDNFTSTGVTVRILNQSKRGESAIGRRKLAGSPKARCRFDDVWNGYFETSSAS